MTVDVTPATPLNELDRLKDRLRRAVSDAVRAASDVEEAASTLQGVVDDLDPAEGARIKPEDFDPLSRCAAVCHAEHHAGRADSMRWERCLREPCRTIADVVNAQ